MSASLSFVTPPPGLDPVVDFSLDEVKGANGLYALHAVAEPSTRMFVVDAAIHLPDYAPEISDEQGEALGLSGPENALLLVVANPAASGTTVNLMAPIVVNSVSGAAAQVILENQDFPLRAALMPVSAAPIAQPIAPARVAVPA